MNSGAEEILSVEVLGRDLRELRLGDRTTAFAQFFGRRRHQRRLLLRRPASKKRQGARSRAAGQGLGGERYGDFRLAAHSMEAGHWGDATCMAARGGGRESGRSVPGGV